jgi:hypothetical protein
MTHIFFKQRNKKKNGAFQTIVILTKCIMDMTPGNVALFISLIYKYIIIIGSDYDIIYST